MLKARVHAVGAISRTPVSRKKPGFYVTPPAMLKARVHAVGEISRTPVSRKKAGFYVTPLAMLKARVHAVGEISRPRFLERNRGSMSLRRRCSKPASTRSVR